ncbi:MAG TPA: MotA/TolQ/ExbB proton channel family protein [Alphaproteobacteria bacterium]|nr:MotA/TolQ/ExbB proton channel family protein [Alphaproteobacteria bacterium]
MSRAAQEGRAAARPRRPGRLGLDLSTILGLGAALLLIGLAIAAGGRVAAFFDLPSVLIVLGGTLAVTTASFSFADMARLPGLLGRMLATRRHEPGTVGQAMLDVADLARRQGTPALRALIADMRGDAPLARAVGLVIEGLPPDQLEHLLGTEYEGAAARWRRAAALLRRAAEVAPAMGLIGTLIGLVQMLGRLQEPSAIGPAMALALLTTFYGALLAYVVLQPLAAKLDRAADEEAVLGRLYLAGAVSIARQENPRRLELLLNTILPPEQRVRWVD